MEIATLEEQIRELVRQLNFSERSQGITECASLDAITQSQCVVELAHDRILPPAPVRQFYGSSAGERCLRDQSSDHGPVYCRPNGACVRGEDLRLSLARHQGPAAVQGPPELVRDGGLP